MLDKFTLQQDELEDSVEECGMNKTLEVEDFVSPEQVEFMNTSENRKLDEEVEEKTGKYNTINISNTVTAGLRYGVSSTQIAAVASGFLMDFIDGGILSKFSYLAMDKIKVTRCKEKLLTEAREGGNATILDEMITCLYFDRRWDNTRALVTDEDTGRLHLWIMKENNISVTSEPDGEYRTHLMPPTPDSSRHPTKEEALGIFNWMKQYGIDKDLKVFVERFYQLKHWVEGQCHCLL